jgi:hypothetical protein
MFTIFTPPGSVGVGVVVCPGVGVVVPVGVGVVVPGEQAVINSETSITDNREIPMMSSSLFLFTETFPLYYS